MRERGREGRGRKENEQYLIDLQKYNLVSKDTIVNQNEGKTKFMAVCLFYISHV